MSNDNTKPRSETNVDAVDAMADEDIDLSDIPELTEEWFKSATMMGGDGQSPVFIGRHPADMNGADAADFTSVLKEHLNNVSAFTRSKSQGERYAAKKRLDDSFDKLVSFSDLSPTETQALDEVTRLLASK